MLSNLLNDSMEGYFLENINKETKAHFRFSKGIIFFISQKAAWPKY